MILSWPISANVNLSHTSRNRQAWIGQASCCFNHGANERSTKIAWRQLRIKQQIKANLTADKVIVQWERNYIKNNQLDLFDAQKIF
jgi:hypothetical protein